MQPVTTTACVNWSMPWLIEVNTTQGTRCYIRSGCKVQRSWPCSTSTKLKSDAATTCKYNCHYYIPTRSGSACVHWSAQCSNECMKAWQGNTHILTYASCTPNSACANPNLVGSGGGYRPVGSVQFFLWALKVLLPYGWRISHRFQRGQLPLKLSSILRIYGPGNSLSTFSSNLAVKRFKSAYKIIMYSRHF